MAGRKGAGLETASERHSPLQGDRGARLLPLPVHHGGDCAGAHGVRQEHPQLLRPLLE